MTPYLHFGAFTWNIDCAVGQGGQNSVNADVSYIQWYYWLASRNPRTPPERQAIYRLVNPNGMFSGVCTGRADDPLAVTDPAGRVYGIEGLRVGDASLMPSVPRANTNVPVMMIGEKIAASVLESRG